MSVTTHRFAQKCMHCSLHFNVYSWEKDWSEAQAPTYCPECGTRGMCITLAIVEEEGQIYDHVPGISGVWARFQQ